MGLKNDSRKINGGGKFWVSLDVRKVMIQINLWMQSVQDTKKKNKYFSFNKIAKGVGLSYGTVRNAILVDSLTRKNKDRLFYLNTYSYKWERMGFYQNLNKARLNNFVENEGGV